jgi:hypothetical protein
MRRRIDRRARGTRALPSLASPWRARAAARAALPAAGLVLVLAASALVPARVSAHDAPRPDAHAPIGVMGDHTHHAGEVMLSYRYARMRMDGNRDGTDRLSASEVLRSFPVAPTDMDTEMHVFGVMWAPLDRVTLMAMLPYVRKTMDHRTRAGGRFTTRSDGLGDLKLTALVPFLERGPHRLHANLGLSVPTGSTDEKDRTPMGRVVLPYPMQLGSGTVDLMPGLTWNARLERWSFGAQALGTIRPGRGDDGYALGNAYQVTGWVARRIAPWLSLSARLDWQQWFDVRGEDDRLDPRVVPTADPDLRAGRRLDGLVGANFVVTGGPLAGHRFAVELGLPIHQDLDGPQLESDWRLVAGWQLAF